MDTRTETHMGTTVAWIALIIGIVALIIAWVAFNRASEQTLTQEVTQESSEAVEEVRLGAAQQRAEARLTALQNDEELRASSTAYQRELQEIRSDLEAAYNDAGAEARAEWSTIGSQFDQLENQVRTGAANSLQTLQSLIGTLAADVRSDSE